jgi:6-pyruvoyltetrahydropterin/6-carboxytetrahydropterin synthase
VVVEVVREYTFDAAHYLSWHAGKCKAMHGHTYRVEVTIAGELNHDGVVMDFADLDEVVERAVISVFDHTLLNELLPNPTAELLAQDICMRIESEGVALSELRLWETPRGSVRIRREAR